MRTSDAPRALSGALTLPFVLAIRLYQVTLSPLIGGHCRFPTKPYDGHCIIQADRRIDFELVRKTIFSINSAGWTHIQFTVSQQGGSPTAEGGEGGEPAPEG